MKKTLLFIVFAICVLSTIFAQSPFKYQAVIHDKDGVILTNKNVGLRMTIMQDTIPSVVYREEFNKTSDQFGIIEVEVGTGSVLKGNYLTINWGALNIQLQVEIDLNGGTTYTLLGTSPILSVPVANYAVKAGGATFPAGLIMPFAGAIDKIPVGWLLCDGSAVSRTQYADLYKAILINWGAGDMTSTFNLPDLRGMFLRGVDGSKGNDPDNANRTASNTGGNTGNKVGSVQSDSIISHNHTGITSGGKIPATPVEDFTNYYNTRAAYPGVHAYTWNASPNDRPLSINNFGGKETRPKNAYVLYIIKY